MQNIKVKTILNIIEMIIVIQLILNFFTYVIFVFMKRTDYSDHIASMLEMIVFTILFICFIKKKYILISVFPTFFGKYYIIATTIAIVLYLTTPSNYLGGFQPIVFLFYASVVTPVFEEIIFRGYIWNKLNGVFEKEWMTYIVSTILFAFWHIGYVDAIAFRVDTGLVHVMFWKVITGLCYGIILGILRCTKGVSSTRFV